MIYRVLGPVYKELSLEKRLLSQLHGHLNIIIRYSVLTLAECMKLCQAIIRITILSVQNRRRQGHRCDHAASAPVEIAQCKSLLALPIGMRQCRLCRIPPAKATWLQDCLREGYHHRQLYSAQRSDATVCSGVTFCCNQMDEG